MTRRRDLETHRKSLEEIGEILDSMKTLAYLETRKLSRFLGAESSVVRSIEEIAADFLSFHPEALPGQEQEASVAVLIGSERGFCGDFNRAVVQKLQALRQDSGPERPRLLVVGHKLHNLLANDPDVSAFIEGASVAEDIGAVLQNLVDEVNALQTSMTKLSLAGICHTADDVRITALLPPFSGHGQTSPAYRVPPVLNIPPAEFVLDLVEHYLLAALNHMLSASLMVENDRRLSHLERAVRHLEEKSRELTRKSNALRQEEIIEEIEVILLSATAQSDGPAGR